MRRFLLTFVLLVLAGAVANLVIAIGATTHSIGLWRLPQRTLLTGAEASAAGWPAPPPRSVEGWPPVSRLGESRAFAYRGLLATSDNGRKGNEQLQFHMMIHTFGWPLPVLTQVQLLFPWEDMRWASSVRRESDYMFSWLGFILNPLFFATSAWLLFFAPVHAWRMLQRAQSRKVRSLGAHSS